MQLAEFIDASNKATTTESLFILYRDAMAANGFDRVLFGLLTEHHTIGRPAQHACMHNHPDSWIRYYTEKKLGLIDPVRQYIPHAEGPFTWASLPQRMVLIPQQVEFLRLAAAAGLHDALSIPLRGPRGALAEIGAAGSRAGVDLSMNRLSEIGLLSHQFYWTFLRVERKPQQRRQTVIVHLSPTELKVLKWCANGNSRRQSSEALGISEETVKFHIRNIRRKLDARTAPLAVNKALSLGLISNEPDIENK